MSKTTALLLYVAAGIFLVLSWVFSHPRSGLANYALPAGLTSLAALLFVLAYNVQSV